MVHINSDEKSFVPPYKVIILDATDAFYYADIMESVEIFDTINNLIQAKKIADALFIVKNYKWDSLDQMNECDGGYDVRVYDINYSCVYAAHTQFKDKWYF